MAKAKVRKLSPEEFARPRAVLKPAKETSKAAIQKPGAVAERPRALLKPAKVVINASVQEPEAVVTTGSDLGHTEPWDRKHKSQKQKSKAGQIPEERKAGSPLPEIQAGVLGSELAAAKAIAQSVPGSLKVGFPKGRKKWPQS